MWEPGDPWYTNPKYEKLLLIPIALLFPILLAIGIAFPYGF